MPSAVATTAATTRRRPRQKNRCQCDPTCRRQPLANHPFCATHIRRCGRASPLSGWEPAYNPAIYNNDKRIRETHNCFAYAIGAYEPPHPSKCNEAGDCDVKFHQPGNYAGYDGFRANEKKRCPDIVARVLGDNPAIRLTRFEDRCPAGTSKVAFAVDPKNDYHVWRQDSNGLWSDKHGSQPVGNLDASGRLQYDPALSNRNYGYSDPLNYSSFCSYMCVPRHGPVKTRRSGGRLRWGSLEPKRQMRRKARQSTRRKH